MSGILATWNSDQPESWQSMMADLAVLGRDGQGDWHDPEMGLSLGRTQLFNTPESCLESPVVDAEGCVLVWDGRLDDRASVMAGRTSVTDAQLLIESYRRWGVECFNYWVGEFALVLWDRHHHRLLVGCDKTGQRTVAYYWNGRTLLICSRALTLLRHPQVSAALDEGYIAHALCDLGAQPPGTTPFIEIKRLQPGYALILQAGQLQHYQIGQLAIHPSPSKIDKPEVYYEKFWYVLKQVVRDRLRSHLKPCTTLSGGLDSTTITVSLLQQLSGINAFSLVTDLYPEFDEREPIRAFLERYPQTSWHEVNCDTAWALTESWQELPLPDDPLINCTLPMHLRLMQTIQQQGFGLVFDGDWGDELFRTSLVDLYKSRNWNSIWQLLKHDSHRHVTLVRELMPSLPSPLQSLWFARHLRRHSPIPPWLKDHYQQSTELQESLQQYLQLSLVYGHEAVLVACLNGGFHAGIRGVYKLIRSHFGLEFSSPLQDQRVLEFTLSLPAPLQSDPIQEKVFLRSANQTTLPEIIRTRPKENYFDPLKYAGIGKGEAAIAALQQLKNCSFLKERMDTIQVEAYLYTYRYAYQKHYAPGQPFNNKIASQLYSLFAFSRWHQQLSLLY